MTMDHENPKDVGDFAQADVLIEGNKILDVGPNLNGGGAAVIDVSGRIVMPGFIDTHHHQFETALRSFLADGVLINDGSGSPSGSTTYYEYILHKFAPGVSAAGRLHQRAVRRTLASSTTASRRCTTSRRFITRPQHSDAAIQALIDTGRRAAFGYFESAGQVWRRHSGKSISAGRHSHHTNQWFGGANQSLEATGSSI